MPYILDIPFVRELFDRYPTEELKNHVLRVATYASHHGKIYYLIGLLHDIIEDTDTILEELPEDIKTDIDTLTRRSDETYFEYINRVKNGSNRAITVKLYDIKDHLKQKDTLSKSLEKRYLKAQSILMGDNIYETDI